MCAYVAGDKSMHTVVGRHRVSTSYPYALHRISRAHTIIIILCLRQCAAHDERIILLIIHWRFAHHSDVNATRTRAFASALNFSFYFWRKAFYTMLDVSSFTHFSFAFFFLSRFSVASSFFVRDKIGENILWETSSNGCDIHAMGDWREREGGKRDKTAIK